MSRSAVHTLPSTRVVSTSAKGLVLVLAAAWGLRSPLQLDILTTIRAGALFTALIVIPWMLTFRGVFAPQGLLGAGLQTTSWLYIVWHAGFPMFVIAYVVLKDRVPARQLWLGSVRAAIFWSVALTAGAVSAPTWRVTMSRRSG